MNDTVRTAVGYSLPVAWILLLVAFARPLGPVGRFLGATVGLLLSIKVGAWVLLRARGNEFSLSPLQVLLFFTVWPGVRPDLFAGSGEHGAGSEDHADPDAGTFLTGYAFVVVGLVVVALALLAPPALGVGVRSWLLVAGVLFVVHFGVGRILPFGLRWLGYPVPPLFNDPRKSRSIGEFWSDRWNRPFVNMDRLFVTRPLADRIGMGGAAFTAFLVSGALHELALSYTAGGGWGGPLLYFLLQATLYTVEYRFFPEEGWPLARRVWTYVGVLAPLPLLFHAPFLTTFVVPVVEGGRALLVSYPLSAYLAAGLWLGAAGHFLVLVASAQVPSELEWKTDLATLRPLNRKLMWTYGGFIVLAIVSFAVLTILFHRQFLAGTPVALGVCGMIAVFWTARVLVDFFYFSHEDWPDGVEYVVGHALLTSLFLFLILVYGGTIVVNVL